MNYLCLMMSCCLTIFVFGDDIKLKEGAEKHFSATDDMIARYALQNPAAAADYEEVMGDLMKEFNEAEEQRNEDAKKMENGETNTRRRRPEYEQVPLYDAETMLEMEKIMAAHQASHTAALRKEAAQAPAQHTPHNHHKRETEEEMENRIRSEIMQDMKKEKFIRDKLEREIMDKRDVVSQQQWPAQGSTYSDTGVYCLPYTSICDANILVAGAWCAIAIAVAIVLKKSSKQRRKKGKKE